jgi:hypothetical protein
VVLLHRSLATGLPVMMAVVVGCLRRQDVSPPKSLTFNYTQQHHGVWTHIRSVWFTSAPIKIPKHPPSSSLTRKRKILRNICINICPYRRTVRQIDLNSLQFLVSSPHVIDWLNSSLPESESNEYFSFLDRTDWYSGNADIRRRLIRISAVAQGAGIAQSV